MVSRQPREVLPGVGVGWAECVDGVGDEFVVGHRGALIDELVGLVVAEGVVDACEGALPAVCGTGPVGGRGKCAAFEAADDGCGGIGAAGSAE